MANGEECPALPLPLDRGLLSPDIRSAPAFGELALGARPWDEIETGQATAGE